MFSARERRWFAGRVLSLRLDGLNAAEATEQATRETVEHFAKRVNTRVVLFPSRPRRVRA